MLSKEYMRAEHMQLLDLWRESVVRQTDRVYTNPKGKQFVMSLSNTCLDCHSNKADFCDRPQLRLGAAVLLGLPHRQTEGEFVMDTSRRRVLQLLGLSAAALSAPPVFNALAKDAPVAAPQIGPSKEARRPGSGPW